VQSIAAHRAFAPRTGVPNDRQFEPAGRLDPGHEGAPAGDRVCRLKEPSGNEGPLRISARPASSTGAPTNRLLAWLKDRDDSTWFSAKLPEVTSTTAREVQYADDPAVR